MKDNRFLVLAVLTAICITMLGSVASAGHINVRGAGGSANLAGTGGIGATLDWGADAEAGYDLWGYVDELGDEFDTTMVYADAASSEFSSVEADLKELSISGKVSGPEGSNGYAFAVASGQALGYDDVAMNSVVQIDTWLFAHTVTAAAGGAKATASASASGTTEGTGWQYDKGEISALSKGTVSATSSVKSTDSTSSEAASMAAIGASALITEDLVGRAGYEYFPMDHTDLDDFSDGYLYPGNGLMAASEVEGTGTAKATAEGSAESGGVWDDPNFNFEAGASGAVSSSVSGKEEAGAFGLSAIHAWAYYNTIAMVDPVATGDTGTSILTGGAAMSGDSKASAAMSASGKSYASLSLDMSGITPGPGSPPLDTNLESASSGAIKSKVASTDEGEAFTGSIIAGRAVAEPGDGEDLEWGILLPAGSYPPGYLFYSVTGGEGGLYTLVGSVSEAMAKDGKASADVAMSGKASAKGDGRDGDYPNGIYGEVSGSAASSGEITSKTKASNGGEALSTSQIAALGGVGTFDIDPAILQYGMNPPQWFEAVAEVGGMSYLTTSAMAESLYDDSASVKSSVSGSSSFEGDSFIHAPTTEYHAAETEAEGTVTASAGASDTARAASSSTLFSAALTEAQSTLPFDAAVIDYSLIMSDAGAESEYEYTGTAKGSAEGSTSASGYLGYIAYLDGVIEEAESVTSADGAMKTEAKASGDSFAYSVAELKSLNIIEPETGLVGTNPAIIISDDSDLVSFATADGGPNRYDKSSAKAQMTGKTASEGSADYNVFDWITLEPISEFHLEAETAASNADKVTVSGSGNGYPYGGAAMSYAVSSAWAESNSIGDKYAGTAGMFGTWAETMGDEGKVKAEAKIDTVKVKGYADPDGAEAEIGASGGVASARVKPPNPSNAPPPSYSGALKGELTDSGSTQTSPEWAESHVYMMSEDSLGPVFIIGPPIPSPELTNPVAFWPLSV